MFMVWMPSELDAYCGSGDRIWATNVRGSGDRIWAV